MASPKRKNIFRRSSFSDNISKVADEGRNGGSLYEERREKPE